MPGYLAPGVSAPVTPDPPVYTPPPLGGGVAGREDAGPVSSWHATLTASAAGLGRGTMRANATVVAPVMGRDRKDAAPNAAVTPSLKKARAADEDDLIVMSFITAFLAKNGNARITHVTR